MTITNPAATEANNETLRNLESSPSLFDSDSTMRRAKDLAATGSTSDQCCLVQIYPADVVSGMLLLEADRLVVGRDAAVDLVLVDGSVSRQHAEFVKKPDGYSLRDLGSTNGSLVNGERVVEKRLRSGDTVQIGSFIFKFLSANSVETKYHETVYSAMTRDALTGAMNKRYLNESLDREVARAVRQQQTLSVLMIDIDHFKRVNDTHGHLVGDEVLRHFGARILESCRTDDLLARYGGEEFCLVLCSTVRDDALLIAERSRQIVADRPFETAVGPLAITASFGLACLDPSSAVAAVATRSEDLIRLADERLYEAKKFGRNRVVG